MRQKFGIVLSLMLAIVLVNDVSRLAAVHFSMESIAQVAADSAVATARANRQDSTAGYEDAVAAISSENADVVGYRNEDGGVHVWVEGPVTATVIISPIVSLWTGGSWSDPMTVTKDYRRSY